MLYDPIDFLHSLATYAAAAAATRLAPPLTVNYCRFGNLNTKPWNLFVNSADESTADNPWAVLRIFGGTHERINPKQTINVQCEVQGQGNINAWTLANGLFRVLVLDNQEHELRMLTVPGFKIVDHSANGSWMLVDALTMNLPGQIGRDDRGRVKIVSNFSLGFYKVS